MPSVQVVNTFWMDMTAPIPTSSRRCLRRPPAFINLRVDAPVGVGIIRWSATLVNLRH
jgi:hypothetical protein